MKDLNWPKEMHELPKICAPLIRRATGTDAERLIPLIQAHAAFEQSIAKCEAHQLTDALNHPNPKLLAWIAIGETQTLGYASATVDFSTWQGREFGYLDCLFVTKAARGHHIGEKLFVIVRDYFASKDIHMMEWQTPEWNTDAIRFYNRIGGNHSKKIRFIASTSNANASTHN